MRILVVAPHPDDETLGVGGTILRRKVEGYQVAWLIVTEISQKYGWAIERIRQRKEEIGNVGEMLGFDHVYNLRFPSTHLDVIPTNELIGKIAEVFRNFEPEEVFIPHHSDVHSDHRIVFDAVASCTKWFRYPSIKRILAYETLSETNFNLRLNHAFHPNYFVNIETYLDRKLEIMRLYKTEIAEHPFPRSLECIKSLARLRGAASGFLEAEAFELLKERI